MLHNTPEERMSHLTSRWKTNYATAYPPT